MRRASLLALTVAAALLGGAAALGIGAAAGWVGADHAKTVVIRETVAEPASVASRVVPSHERPVPGNGFDPAQIYALRSAGVVTIFSDVRGQVAQGSGFVVSSAGVILTNAHVITDAGQGAAAAAVHAADQLFVEFADHDRVPAKIVGWDVYDDVGVIRVDPKAHALSPVPLGESSDARVGEPVAAIGSPFGNEDSLTVGVVSATQRSIESLTSRFSLVDAIQTDAAINHGNSGGPLFDASGHVIGINAQIRSDSGTAEGVGFAVPIDSARRSMEELIATGRVSYAYLGVTTEDLTPSLARHIGYPVGHGALIDSVLAGTPSAKAGLRGGSGNEQFNGLAITRGGDVILAIDGHPVGNAEDLVRIVTEYLHPGKTAEVTILRANRRLQFRVVPTNRPANPHGG